ncbi:hypothetical protein Droror1_Dr00006796 [Drosera rotundifolia]
MKTYKPLFVKHDGERFREYLFSVEKGEAKIAAGTLLPLEIIAELERIVHRKEMQRFNDMLSYDGSDDDNNDDEERQKQKEKIEEKEEDDAELKVLELQRKRMVEDVAKKGKLKSDVSGSMNGIPMNVTVALGLLVSELSEEPWKGKLITFSQNPQLHVIKGNDLKSKVEFIKNMDWGMNTDFQKVFDLMLEVAVQGNLKEQDMIKRVIVFSDMEFDEASANPWETDYMAIKRKFGEKGYGAAVPEIVFWNLRDSRSTPVPGTQEGVALMSGFSKNLLTLFLDGGGIVNPEAIMESAISGKEYQKLVVLD